MSLDVVANKIISYDIISYNKQDTADILLILFVVYHVVLYIYPEPRVIQRNHLGGLIYLGNICVENCTIFLSMMNRSIDLDEPVTSPRINRRMEKQQFEDVYPIKTYTP